VGPNMSDNGRLEPKHQPSDPREPSVSLGFRRSVFALVVLAFGALVVVSVVFAAEDEGESFVAPVPIPDVTSSTVSDSVTSTSIGLVSVTSTVADVAPEAEQELPRISGTFRRFEDVPLYRERGESVVWSGSEIIAWGGWTEPQRERGISGAVIDPETGNWRAMGDPSFGLRFGHTAVWAGDRMIIWGGFVQFDEEGGFPYREVFADGAMYDPKLDRWTSVPEAPIGRQQEAVAVWTGTEMIVVGSPLGGPQRSDEMLVLSAAAFNPESGSWRLLADVAVSPATSSRPSSLSAVWTGRALVVSGALIGDDAVGVYRPDNDEWDLVAVPIGVRSEFSSVWTGTEVIFWGGSERDSQNAAGYALNPETSQWRALPPPPVAERAGHGAAWTGTEILMWGGAPVRPFTNSQERFFFGVLYNPQTDQWTVMDVQDAPRSVFGPGSFVVEWLGDSALLWNGVLGQSGVLTLGALVPPPSSNG